MPYTSSQAVGNQTIDDKVAQIVAGLLPERAQSRPLTKDESLTSAGLSSLGMVNLLLEIEGSFNKPVPAGRVRPKSFRSVDSIWGWIERTGQGAWRLFR